MNLADLNENSPRYKARKRVGRGHGSGAGKTSGRGQKGSGSRSGYGMYATFAGGQMPLHMKIAKRGFSNHKFRTDYDLVNLGDLNDLAEGTEVSLESLEKSGQIRSRHGRLKVLAKGKLERKLVITANKFSAAAKKQIEELGGEAKEV